jgi:3',5'-cyclic AMP phosphodiesterase CpdA
MRTLVHLSDLHFGRTDAGIVSAVRAALDEIEPDILVVSGDFTQRARRSQFTEARTFLDALPGQKILVPGNHDVPLWNVFARFLFPLANYRRFITRDLLPVYADGDVIVVGINTARSFTWKSGRINRRQIEALRQGLCRSTGNVIKIVVTHHPFDLAPDHDGRELVGRAAMAMEQLAACGADVLLAGHLHDAYTGGTAKRYQIRGYSALVVQAGTATSTRLRGSVNSFNVLRIDPPKIAVEVLSWNPGLKRFAIGERKVYVRRPEQGWLRLPDEEAGLGQVG